MKQREETEITVMMPCLNEARTIGACIKEATDALQLLGVSYEILVVDNGSTDNSAYIAENLGARVVLCREKGYGNAIRCGLQQAKGKYIVYADCDLSYDFSEVTLFYQAFCEGAEFVAGNRWKTKPLRTAMSISHQLGVPVLSFLGRCRYGVKIRDFHCGIRGIRRDCVERLALRSVGMEFATEIIAKAAKNRLVIKEIPVTLRPDGRDGESHLRTVRDGLRHLFFLCKPLH